MNALPPQHGTALAETLQRLPREIFGVIDAALVPDLSTRLAEARLAWRPLYLEAADQAGVSGGPHMVDLSDRRHAPRLLQALGDTCPIVFWSWPNGELPLYRHLRRLNMVEIPREPGASIDRRRHETVLFRHADPKVMADLLPLLNAGQYARILGPARGILLNLPGQKEPLAVPRPDGLPPAPRGPLSIEPEQYRALVDTRRRASAWRIAQYLRKTAPRQTAHMDDRALHAHAARFLAEAAGLGVESEACRGRWCFLQTLCGGRLMENPDTRHFMTVKDPATPPDRRVRMLMDQTARALR